MINKWIFLVLVLLAASSVHAKDMQFCMANQPAPPFLLGTTTISMNESGIVPDLLFIASQNSNVDIHINRRAWKRCIEEVKLGKVDAVAAFVYSDERDNWSAFPKTDGILDDRYFYQSNYMVFTYPDSGLTWDGEHLLPKTAKVQSIPGYVSDQILQDMGFMPSAPLQPIKAFELVSRGLLDGFVMEALIGQTILNELNLTDKVVTLEAPFTTTNWYAAFSKQAYEERPEDIEAFWTALKAARIEHSKALFDLYL
ncbi:hypothetical protein KO489_08335 [Reinekea forsetii]|nr:hypothetical protein [Reinekea forsetii]